MFGNINNSVQRRTLIQQCRQTFGNFALQEPVTIIGPNVMNIVWQENRSNLGDGKLARDRDFGTRSLGGDQQHHGGNRPAWRPDW